MRASYLLQLVNIISSAALLLMVLLFLDPQSHLQWVLFVTLVGAFIQAETSLNAIVARHICRLLATGGRDGLAGALVTSSRLYKRFGLLGGLLTFIVGGAYIASADNGRFSEAWIIEWSIYCGGFVIYYSLTNYACTLVALEKLETFASIGIALRLINVALACLLLFAGLSVLGMAISVFVAFVFGAVLFRSLALRVIRQEYGIESLAGVAASNFSLRHVGSHALFIVGAYFAYRFGLLFDASATAETSRQASFGFALQLFALLNVLAIVPITMRIAPLVRSVEAGEKGETLRELGKLGLLVNAVYLAGATVLVVGSGLVGWLLPSSAATLPLTGPLVAMAAAFWIEINITVLVNGLLAAQDFRFWRIYYASLAVALTVASILFLLGVNFFVAFLVVPAAIQACFALREIFKQVGQLHSFGVRDYLRAMGVEARDIVSRIANLGKAYR